MPSPKTNEPLATAQIASWSGFGAIHPKDVMSWTSTAWTEMATRNAVSHRVDLLSHTSRKAPVTQKRPRWKTKPRTTPRAKPVNNMVFLLVAIEIAVVETPADAGARRGGETRRT